MLSISTMAICSISEMSKGRGTLNAGIQNNHKYLTNDFYSPVKHNCSKAVCHNTYVLRGKNKECFEPALLNSVEKKYTPAF